jgi:hypothetical protein
MVAMLLISDSAMAQQAAADNSKGLIGLAAGFGIGIAVLGGAIGQIGAEAGAGGQLVPCVRKAGLGHGRSIIHGKAPDKEAQGRCGIRRRKRR